MTQKQNSRVIRGLTYDFFIKEGRLTSWTLILCIFIFSAICSIEQNGCLSQSLHLLYGFSFSPEPAYGQNPLQNVGIFPSAFGLQNGMVTSFETEISLTESQTPLRIQPASESGFEFFSNSLKSSLPFFTTPGVSDVEDLGWIEHPKI